MAKKTESKSKGPVAEKAESKPKGPAYVATQDLTWCGQVYKSGETVPVSNRNEIRRLKARELIEEK